MFFLWDICLICWSPLPSKKPLWYLQAFLFTGEFSPKFDLYIYTHTQRKRKEKAQICQILKIFFFKSPDIYDKLQQSRIAKNYRMISVFFSTSICIIIIIAKIWVNNFLDYCPINYITKSIKKKPWYYLPTYLRTSLRTYLPTYYLPTYLPNLHNS